MLINFSVAPLRIATFTGFVMSGLGLCGALWALEEAIFSGTPPGWA